MKVAIILGGVVLLGLLFVQPSFAGYRETVLADGPDAYWPFDESSGNTGVDLVGGNDATHRAPAEFGKKRIFKGTVTSGVPGSRFAVEGVDDFAVRYDASSAPHNGSDSQYMLPETSQVTFEVALKSTQELGGSIVGGLAGSGFNTGIWLNAFQGGGYFEDNCTDCAGPGNIAMSVDNADEFTFGVAMTQTGTINDGEWHHIVTRWDGPNTERSPNNMDIFIDGVKQTGLGGRFNSDPSFEHETQGDSAIVEKTLFTGPTYFGVNQRSGTVAPHYEGGGQFTGDMDEVSIYSKALTDAQIINHYNNWATGIPEPATLALLAGGGLLLLRRRRAA